MSSAASLNLGRSQNVVLGNGLKELKKKKKRLEKLTIFDQFQTKKNFETHIEI